MYLVSSLDGPQKCRCLVRCLSPVPLSRDLPEGRKGGLVGQKVGGEGLHCHQEHHRKYLKYKR